MTNPAPPCGWRIVDKAKDDPRKFDDIKYWVEEFGEWLDACVSNEATSWNPSFIIAVPIDTNNGRRRSCDER